MIPGRAVGQESHRATVDDLGGIKRWRALHLRTETELGIFLGARNAGLRLMEARKHFLGVVSDG